MLLTWPVDTVWRITSPYGERVHPVTGIRTFHSGIDIGCPEGTPIFAPCPGICMDIWNDEKHGGGLSMRWRGYLVRDGKEHEVRFGFAHLLKVDDAVVNKRSQWRKAGTLLAYSGGVPGTPGAGRSTGAHLHMTLYIDGNRVDPCDVSNWNVVLRGGK
ncbi:MAG: M23 family metallopeptidase [Akkermansia sp.]|nr:M23 family metallopeptidase [Akkermansia sp.]